MNKHLSRVDVDAIARTMSFADMILQPRHKAERPTAPFSKRAEGRARRSERRQVRARKAEWLNS